MIDKNEFFVRLDTGLIFKTDKEHILSKDKKTLWFAGCLSDVKKVSHNLLDILEPMDLLLLAIPPDDCGGIVVPRVPETLNQLEKYKSGISAGEIILKGVTLHEMINNVMFEVN